jgi:hypothetical protein
MGVGRGKVGVVDSGQREGGGGGGRMRFGSGAASRTYSLKRGCAGI